MKFYYILKWNSLNLERNFSNLRGPLERITKATMCKNWTEIFFLSVVLSPSSFIDVNRHSSLNGKRLCFTLVDENFATSPQFYTWKIIHKLCFSRSPSSNVSNNFMEIFSPLNFPTFISSFARMLDMRSGKISLDFLRYQHKVIHKCDGGKYLIKN